MPFSLATAMACLKESIATTTQTLSLERPLFFGAPGSCSTRVSSKYISSIQTLPERTTLSCQPLTVENTLWRHRNAVEWLTSATSSMRRREALWHMTSTILMILWRGSLALAKMVPVVRPNLRPQAGHRNLGRGPFEPSDHATLPPQDGHLTGRAHFASSPSIVSAPYFSRHIREPTAPLSSSSWASVSPSTRERRSREPLSMGPPTSWDPAWAATSQDVAKQRRRWPLRRLCLAGPW